MNADARWLRIKELFRECQQLPESERDLWLLGRCSDDLDLLKEVRGLLSAQRAAADILDDGAIGVLRRMHQADPALDLVGQRIGAYRL